EGGFGIRKLDGNEEEDLRRDEVEEEKCERLSFKVALPAIMLRCLFVL
ncbi:hypothetical protein A2U01_0096607, partial [Trifolium medium]|nr:hypothetical protein [Trifolium medium]